MIVAERYILRRVFGVATMTLASLLVIVLITQVLIFVNVVTDSGQAIWTFLRLAAMLVPSVTTIVLPFALLLAICQTLNTMHTDSEIVVLEAAGASHALQIRPILILASAMSALMVLNLLFLEPAANRNLRDIINQSSSNLVKFAVRSGSFHRIEDNLYIQISGQLPGGDFDGIFIADLRNAEAELIYYAQRGTLVDQDETSLLVMTNGEVQRRNTETDDVSVVTFSSYALDFASFGPATMGSKYGPREQTTSYLLDPDPNDTIVQTRPDRIRKEMHRRFSEFLYPMAFALLGLYFSVGARSNREERLWSLAAAAVVALAFRGGGMMSGNGSGSSAVAAAMTYLTPASCIAIFGGLLLTGRRARISQVWIEKIGRAADQLLSLRKRMPFGQRAALFDQGARR